MQSVVRVEGEFLALSTEEFGRHVDDCNNDFKENVMKRVMMLKLQDSDNLSHSIQNLQDKETEKLDKIHKKIAKLENKCDGLNNKIQKNMSVIWRYLEIKAGRKMQAAVFAALKAYWRKKGQKKHARVYVSDFHKVGLLRRSVKAWKYFAHVVGNRLVQKRAQEIINTKI